MGPSSNGGSVEFVGTCGASYAEGQGYISSAKFTNRKLQYAVIGGFAVFEGDIILGRPEKIPVQPPIVHEGLVITGQKYRWFDKTVPYNIDDDLPNQKRVHDAISHWQVHTPIKFVVRTTEVDYVTFRPGDGCSSSVGRRGGQQFITLGEGCSAGNAIHEIGHTVGLWHEQSREDRDSHVMIRWENILTGYEHNFIQRISDGDDVGEYDFGSIMHYPANAFAMDTSKPTIEANQPIGQRIGLSLGDIVAVKSMYP
jgi:hypothetical protein